MLSWVFQGNVGEIIAPFAGPEQQLIVAIQNNQRDKIQDLLQNKGVSPGCCNLHGTTPLHIAVKAGYQDIAEMLLRMGADIAAVDKAGNSALHYAARGGCFTTIEWLIEQGLDASETNSSGQTPYDVSENHALKTLARHASLKEMGSAQGFPAPQQMMMQSQSPLPPPHAPPSSLPLPHRGRFYTPPTQHPLEAPPLSSFENPDQVGFGSQKNVHSQSMTSVFAPTPHQTVVGGGEAATQKHTPHNASVIVCNSSPPPPPTNTLVPPGPPATHVSLPANPSRKINIKPIRPDGFHSSASDKTLQKRYNHTQVHYDLGPPPTVPNQFNYSAPSPEGGGASPSNVLTRHGSDTFFGTENAPSLPIPHQRGQDENKQFHSNP